MLNNAKKLNFPMKLWSWVNPVKLNRGIVLKSFQKLYSMSNFSNKLEKFMIRKMIRKINASLIFIVWPNIDIEKKVKL